MSKQSDRELRNLVNDTVNAIQKDGFKSPTQRAYIYRRLPGVVYSPDEKRAGQIRSLQQANRVRVQQGLAPLTAGEYRMELQSLLTNPQLSPDGIREYHARQISEYLNKDILLTDEEKERVFEKIGSMSDKELSDLIKSYAGKSDAKFDPYTNVHKWLSENILGDKDK